MYAGLAAESNQNLDSYSIEYTFADGTKALVNGRNVANCYNDFATFVHGTKCAAQFSGNIHAPTVQMYKDQRIAPDNIDWKPEPEQVNPWQAEWNVLFCDNVDGLNQDSPAPVQADAQGRYPAPVPGTCKEV